MSFLRNVPKKLIPSTSSSSNDMRTSKSAAMFQGLFTLPCSSGRIFVLRCFQAVIYLVFKLLGRCARVEMHAATGCVDCVAVHLANTGDSSMCWQVRVFNLEAGENT